MRGNNGLQSIHGGNVRISVLYPLKRKSTLKNAKGEFSERFNSVILSPSPE